MTRTLLLLLAISVTAAAQEPAPVYSRQMILRELFADRGDGSTSLAERPDVEYFQSTPSDNKKSVALAGLYSLLLPGMGELYAGDYGTGKYFTIAEGILWITLAAVDMHASSLQDDARSFAVQHAGITVENKSDEYFVDIGDFNNVYSYNTAVLRGRLYYSTYDPQSSYAWRWDVDANRTLYREMRVSSDEMYDNTKFVAGAIVLNHVVSAINGIRVAIAHNKSVEHSSLIDIHASLLGSVVRPEGIMLSFTKHF